MKVLVTGAAGFIGFHLAKRLVSLGYDVFGLDSINDYYDIKLKYARLEEMGIGRNCENWGQIVASRTFHSYRFMRAKLEDKDCLEKLFRDEGFEIVVNLAAQAGVRYSLTNPQAYIDSNIIGFANILECCRHNMISHLVYASSSSVYGLNKKIPFSTSDPVDHPISLYAATKKSNELMAHTYSHLFGLATTGLRFFTVYGPWGRPDMALFLFTKAIIEDRPIDVFNYGEMKRDFTYIDDVVEGVVRVMRCPPLVNDNWTESVIDPASSSAPYRLFNIGNSSPVRLMDLIEAVEMGLGKVAIKKYHPIQAGDVPETWADVTDLQRAVGYKPETSIVVGVSRFLDWYQNYYENMSEHS